jgi:hypothetical protein
LAVVPASALVWTRLNGRSGWNVGPAPIPPVLRASKQRGIAASIFQEHSIRESSSGAVFFIFIRDV